MPGALDTLRLRDIVTLLNTQEGRPLLDKVEARTRELAQVRENDPLYFYEEGGKPIADSFTVDILEDCFDRNFKFGVKRALPMAITTALAKAADQNGMLKLADVKRLLGPYAADLAQDIAAKLEHFESPELPINTKYEGGSPEVIEKIARSVKRGWARDRMELLGWVTHSLGGPDTLKGWKGASLGHLFATRPALYEELEKNGWTRENHLVSGKGYSRNIDVVHAMRSDQWWVDPSLDAAQTNYEAGKTDTDRARAVLSKMFEGIDPRTSTQQFMLIDDGANLLMALHEPQFQKYAHLCRVVEQTDHGIQRIEKFEKDGGKLLCPVINMARSWLKKIIEAPMIGEAVLHSTETLLNEIHPGLGLDRKEAALIGLGAVNGETAKALERRGFKRKDIWVYDTKQEVMDQAREMGYSVASKAEALGHGALMISATGQIALKPWEYDLLPNDAVVVNAGSGNHEVGMSLLDPYDKEVANLPDGRRFSRLEADPSERDSRQIVQFMKTALGRLDLQDSMLRVRTPRMASVLGYDEDAKSAIRMLLENGFSRSSIVVSDLNEEQRAEAERDGFKVVDRDTAIGFGSVVISNEANAINSSADTAKLRKYGIHVFHAELPYQRGPDEAKIAEKLHARTNKERDAILGREEEFYRGYLVNNAAGRAGSGYRHRVLHTGRGSDVLVLRSGYVVNMETGIPPEYVQLILAMLQVATIQASKETRPGLHDLEYQDELLILMEKIMKRIHRSLMVPDFRGLKPAF